MPSSLCEAKVSVTMKPTPTSAVVSPANSPPPSPTPVKNTRCDQASGKKRSKYSAIPDGAPQRQLADGFQPCNDSVICGRGKDCFESEGNKRFRALIHKFLPEYTRAKGKSEKSRIVKKTMDIIREACPDGAFVRKCQDGKWWEVSEKYAREKVGAWFRDCLSHRYKSSSKAKHALKMAKRVSLDNSIDVDDVFSFPSDFESQVKAHERRVTMSDSNTASSSSINGGFYDVDDLCLIPIDSVDF